MALGGALLVTPVAQAAQPGVGQPVPQHTTLAPQTPRKDTPRISSGEIFDMAYIGNRVFIAGTFTSLQNTTGNGAVVNQKSLAAYNLDTGLIDTSFRPTIAGGQVNTVEVSPDGTKLYIAGAFKTINGVSKKNIALLNPTTGAPVTSFTATPNSSVDALAATNSTLYVGGRFKTINNVPMVGLAAVNGATGAVDTGFNNQLSGGIGVNGTLTVHMLKLTHDNAKLLVVHTARQIAGQDRYGVGLIDTATKSLLPWRTRLWDENLPFVGGIQRLYGGDIAPNDQYFVVSSADGGDRPPISDTAVAFPIAGGDMTQPLWVQRSFDSIYSVAITEQAVYIGGHFNWNESPTSPDPWPGLDNVGYGNGQGLSGYALGDAVVRRDHLGALDPATGKAVEWNPGSNSFEGNKAMLATPNGILTGGDGMLQGGLKTGRVAFFDLRTLPAATPTDTTVTEPIQGRVFTAGQSVTITGTAKSASAIKRVQVEIQDRSSKQFLQDDLVTWRSTNNNVYATLGTPSGGVTPWSVTLTFTGSRQLQVMAKAFGTNGTSDPVKDVKKFETFSFDDQTPTTSVTGPSGSIISSTSFTVTGSAQDDHGVRRISMWIRDENLNYLQADGTLSSNFASFSIDPDTADATSTTWRYDVTVPHEGVWRVAATAIDTAGQQDLRSGIRDFNVTSSGVAPTVTITSPVAQTPPTSAFPVTVTPGGTMTFAGTASDDQQLKSVEISLRNSTTGEALASDGTWGRDVVAGNFRVSPVNLNAATYNWSWTTPFTLKPGTYSFSVRATDNLDLSTSGSNQGRLTITAQVDGDAFPNGLLDFTGTDQSLEALHLDLSGTATDDVGVSAVKVSLQDSETRRYVQPNGTMAANFATLNANLATPGGTSTTWTLPVDLPASGNFGVTAYAVDTVGQQDQSTSGATARYLVFPGDADPYLSDTLRQPVEGSSFTDGRIFVSGRAFDDVAMARLDVGISNSLGQFMNSSGSFSTGERYVTAFLTSPGTPGSQYSFTSPVLPAGSYKVRVRPVDNHGQYPLVNPDVNVTVTQPSNQPPVASATGSCSANVCSFDARGSTDENVSTLTYSWNYGNGRTGSGPLPTYSYSTPGAFTVTLTVKDEYNATATTTLPVTITEPAGNQAPTAVISPPNCQALVCNFSGATSADPNTGDTFTYAWDFGDLTAQSTSSAPNHTYAASGTYTVTLTTTDGWGKFSTSTKTVTVG
ncbi:hypothetical protein BA895_07375 [Humibacillus sp. DSM 29435]|uniref:PKD domain-containing protein n=1 Tax=Humibacillus sp. DSM 29435 TaxID=1869167 RepID=UPI000873007F|nr:PKD domain-containing protein [Humibacillus sp. DSM 29435]OFE14962.1 hypothetical protein BA895_07375 [Humibacillus sp. DSM 29435]